MFDHVEINVSDLHASRRFFEVALAPLGYEIAFESPELVDMRADGRSDFGLVRRDPVGPRRGRRGAVTVPSTRFRFRSAGAPGDPLRSPAPPR